MVGMPSKAPSEAVTPGASRATAPALREIGTLRDKSSTLTLKPVVVASNSDTAVRTPTTTMSSTVEAPEALPTVKTTEVVPPEPTEMVSDRDAKPGAVMVAV